MNLLFLEGNRKVLGGDAIEFYSLEINRCAPATATLDYLTKIDRWSRFVYYFARGFCVANNNKQCEPTHRRARPSRSSRPNSKSSFISEAMFLRTLFARATTRIVGRLHNFFLSSPLPLRCLSFLLSFRLVVFSTAFSELFWCDVFSRVAHNSPPRACSNLCACVQVPGDA